MKKHYSVNPERKVITIDDSIKATKQDEKDIALYLSVGYTLRHKSEARAEKAKKRATGMTKEAILNELAGDKEGLATFNSFFDSKGTGKGFFAARKWYTEYKEKK